MVRCTQPALCFVRVLMLMGVVLPWGGGCRQQRPQADVLLVNGHIITMESSMPEVEAMAVANGRILGIGTTDQIRQRFEGVEEIDLNGRTAMPGIVEAHGHLLSLGRSLLELNVEGVDSPDAAVRKVRQRVSETPAGEWIVGWGWDEGAWAEAYPDNEALSRVSPRNPVFLRGLHGFAGWANARALRAAGISPRTPDPPNGEIVRDQRTGEPTGLLKNEAQNLVTAHIPAMTPEQIEERLGRATEECLKNGLTTVHDAGISRETLAALRNLKEKGQLKLRVYAMLDGKDPELIEPYFAGGPEIDPEHRLTVRAVKLFTDGALGSRGAAMMTPYSDAPGTRGFLTTSEEALYTMTVKGLRSGIQIAAHAIGDLGNRVTLNAFARALEEVATPTEPRLRIEHAQVVAVEDIPRFSQLGIIASMQPPHCTSDMTWAESRVGPQRIRGAYAWRAFLDADARLPLSSDFPGETLNPFFGMYAAETRQTPDGKPEGGWYPDQRLTRAEVLNSYTVDAAYSGFQENSLGRLAPGMLADFIVLSDDILTVSSKDLLSMRVLKTYIAGKLVFSDE